MSAESIILSQIFNFDNWAKFHFIDQRKKYKKTVTSEWDIVFSETNPELLRADLHYNKKAAGGKKLPVLMNIHGGGWIIGDKKNSTSYCLTVADTGFFVMNVNYGMPPKDLPSLFEKNDPANSHDEDYIWPYPIQTHFMALKWLEDNASKYNLDLSKVFVSGDSAGAHMTGVVAACFANDSYAKALGVSKPKFTPKGYVMNCGLYSVKHCSYLPIANCMMKKLFGTDRPLKDPDFKYFNPIPYMTKKVPNALVVKGMIDIMTYPQSEMMYRRLKKLGVNVDFYGGAAFPNSFHDFMLLSPTKESKKCLKYTCYWLHDIAENK